MSTLKVTNINSNAASTPPVINDVNGTQIGSFCRAWVNFNGTGTIGVNQTIRASFNVSSVSKSAAGNYTVNFSTALEDGNYAVIFGNALIAASANTTSHAKVNNSGNAGYVKSTSAVNIVSGSSAATGLSDVSEIYVSIFR
jgi:hypothetical protein